MAPECATIETLLHSHFSSPRQRRGAEVPTLVAHGGVSGLGDHAAGFLGAVALAMASGRRLEIGGEESSVLGAGFTSPYDMAYTGSPALNDAAGLALEGMKRAKSQCKALNGSIPGCAPYICCGGKSHYVPRPLDVPYLAASVSQAIVSQVSVTWGYGKKHELTAAMDRRGRGLLTKRVEMLVAGNSGGGMFRHYFEQRLRQVANGTTAFADAPGCAFRFLLRPSAEALRAVERIRPAFWPPRRPTITTAATTTPASSSTAAAAAAAAATGSAAATIAVAAGGGEVVVTSELVAPPPRVALHVRAAGVLLSRGLHSSGLGGLGMYTDAAVTDAAMGCGAVDGVRPSQPPPSGSATGGAGLPSAGTSITRNSTRGGAHGGGGGSSERAAAQHAAQHELEAFTEYWLAAREAERIAATLLHAQGRSGSGGGGPSHSYNHSSSVGPSRRSRWLLATDSPTLKTSAQRRWPHGRSGTTAVAPSHVRCGGAAHSLEKRLETVAEALLLAEADAIVHGVSRFASVALLLCATCVASFNVDLDPHCRSRHAAANKQPAAAAGTRCIGTDGRYSAVNQYDATGRKRTAVPFL